MVTTTIAPQRARLVLATLSLILAACSSTSGSSEPDELPNPPPVVILNTENPLSLSPWSYCWSSDDESICADGEAPDPLPTVGAADDPIEFQFEADGWTFEASVVNLNRGDAEPLDVETLSENTFRLSPIEDLSDRAIELFGRGEAGDVIVTFTVE